MKLTGILKDKVDKAETMEAKKDIIADAGMELTDEELEGVAGGMDIFGMKAICMKYDCHYTILLNHRNPIPPERCPRCGYKMRIVDMS